MFDFEQFLTGLNVLDLSQYIPGPMAGLFLADMGAQVLKIEPPTGDAMQTLGPRDADDRPVFYRALNAGKTIAHMNLKNPEEHEWFLELVAEADVLIEGFRPGVMARLGIDYPVLKKINPRLVMCSISGYGANASSAQTAGHDANYLALAGVLDRNGDEMPSFFDPPVSDVAGSLFAATVILGALHGRRRSGEGCVIDLALADTLMPLQLMQLAGFGCDARVPTRRQTYLNGGAAYYQVYQIEEGAFAVLCAVEPKFWARFCEAAARPDWLARRNDLLPQTDLIEELQAFFSRLGRDEAQQRFETTDCCFSIVRDLAEALDHQRVHERDLVRRNQEGELQALFPARIDGDPPKSRPAPVFIEDDSHISPGGVAVGTGKPRCLGFRSNHEKRGKL